MKNYIILSLFLFSFACQKEVVDKQTGENSSNAKLMSDAIVGKWAPTYLTKNEKGEFVTINTLVALPTLEFTADGKFLSDGKPGADPCGFIGNKYSLKENEIKFSDFKPDPAASCIALYCSGWKIESIQKDSLTLTDCFSTSKYIKVK